MVEFVVGLIALLAAAVGVLAVAALVRADTDSMAAAQEEAVARSMGNGVAEAGGPVSSLRRGRGEAEAELPPAAKPLFGLDSPATLRNEVWLPQTGGVP